MDAIRAHTFHLMLLTQFLAALSWSLSTRLRKQAFFGWWVWAWTTFAAFFTLGVTVYFLPVESRALREGLLLLTTLIGFLQVPLLVFAGASLDAPGRPPRAVRRAALAVAAAAAVAAVALSWRLEPTIVAMSVRHVARTSALAGALLFCAWVFVRHARASASLAGAVTAGFCLLYSLAQLGYTAALARVIATGGAGAPLHPLLDLEGIAGSPLAYLDIVCSCGIALGMALLLVEEHRRSEDALALSVSRGEAIVQKNRALEAEIAVRERAESALRGAETALRESQSRYSLAAAAGGVGVWDLDLDTREMYVDPALKAILGYQDWEIRNHLDDWTRCVHPDDLEQVNAQVQEHLEGKRPSYEVEHRMLHRDGSIRWFLARGSAVRDAAGVPRRLVGTDTDVTARRAAAEALHEVQARHRAILAALPDMMFLLTREGVFLDHHAANPEQLLAPPQQFLGRRLEDALPPPLAAQLRPLVERAAETGGPCELEYTAPVAGGLRHFETRIVRCDSDTVLSVVRDITERRQAEEEARELREELAHVGRVGLLGTLTGSLAHEINQPLTAVHANAQVASRLLADARPDLPELRRILEDIVADNRRAGEVLRRMRNFLRKAPPERAALDLNTTVAEVVRLVGSDMLRRQLSVELELEPRAPQVLGDRVQLQQVVLNLLMNAFDASEAAEPAARQVLLGTRAAGDHAVVSVSDRGPGLPDDRLARIFEPFFTTKPGGMGLGLAMCRAIVEAHGGELRAERNPGGGMTFRFSLPLTRSGELPAADPALAGSPASA